jgi:hypothetical protein
MDAGGAVACTIQAMTPAIAALQAILDARASAKTRDWWTRYL